MDIHLQQNPAERGLGEPESIEILKTPKESEETSEIDPNNSISVDPAIPTSEYLLKPSRASRQDRDPSEKKPKLRTSKDVFDRLKWDSESIEIKSNVLLDISSVYVGYKDRFLGMCELPYDEFQPGGDIPFHRVYYFRTGGPPVDPFIGEDGEVKVREDNWPEGAIILWDRDSRTDLIFNSGNSTIVQSLSSKKCKKVKPLQPLETPQSLPPNSVIGQQEVHSLL